MGGTMHLCPAIKNTLNYNKYSIVAQEDSTLP